MKQFIIFGRPGCGFCIRAKQLCEINNLPHKYIDIWAEGISKQDLEKTVGKPVHTVPQIFHGESYIGGCDDFDAYISTLN